MQRINNERDGISFKYILFGIFFFFIEFNGNRKKKYVKFTNLEKSFQRFELWLITLCNANLSKVLLILSDEPARLTSDEFNATNFCALGTH